MLLGTETTGPEAEGAWPVPRSFSTTGVSILPAQECGGKARQRPGSSGSQLSPARPRSSLYPPPSPAKREANERGKVSSSPPLLSRQLCRKKPQLQAQTLNRKKKSEAAGRRGAAGRQAGRPTSPAVTAPSPRRLFPLPRSILADSHPLGWNEFSNT